MIDVVSWRDSPVKQFVSDGFVNQFSGWLKDQDSMVISGEFTGSIDYLMGFT